MCELFSLPHAVASTQTFPSPIRYPKPLAYTISNSFNFKEPRDDAQQYLDPASIRAQPLYGHIRYMHIHHNTHTTYIRMHTYIFIQLQSSSKSQAPLTCLPSHAGSFSAPSVVAASSPHVPVAAHVAMHTLHINST